MHVYEVAPCIYKIFSKIASLKTYRHGYFSKQKNETGYFCGMTLCIMYHGTFLRYCVVNDGGELQLQLIHLHLRHLPRQRHPDDPHDPLMRLLEIHVNNT